ncbi:MAG: hypothetical protein JXA46_12880 [Dehalococcoidales bacterium]|nr:hypothetical protein [Dehalococcoidales bacterium]
MDNEEQLTETEIRIKALEDEFMRAKAETKQLMMDIRALLMEAGSPLRSSLPTGKGSAQNDDLKG